MNAALFSRWSLLTLMALVLLAAPSAAFAQSAPSIDQMFINFQASTVAIMNLVRWTALPVGLFISYKALMSLKEYTESGGRVKLSTPIMLAALGSTLIAFPVATNIATETLALGAATGTTLSRVPVSGGAPGVQPALEAILMFVKMVGHIAFFRGFLILKGVAEGNQQATIGRALTHVFGGAACINIDFTIQVLANTFAPGLLNGGLGM